MLGDNAHVGYGSVDEVKRYDALFHCCSPSSVFFLCSRLAANAKGVLYPTTNNLPTVLSAPSGVTCSVQGDSVQVKWKHPHGQDGEEPTHGYYVTVQEILKKLRLDAPDFVHVERNVMSVRIRGLKPASTYEIKARLLYKMKCIT